MQWKWAYHVGCEIGLGGNHEVIASHDIQLALVIKVWVNSCLVLDSNMDCSNKYNYICHSYGR